MSVEAAITGRGTVVAQTNAWVELPLLQTDKRAQPIPRVLTLSETPHGTSFVLGSVQPGAEADVLYGSFKSQSGVQTEWMGGLDAAVQCRVRYGLGGVVHDVYMDWIPGTYQLPPSDFVSVSVLMFSAVASEFKATVVLAPGLYEGGMAPTLTGTKVFAAAGSADASRPYKARAFEMWTDSTTANLTALGSNGGTRAVRRDYGAQVFLPPWSPVEVAERLSPLITVTTSAACYVTLRWFLAL